MPNLIMVGLTQPQWDIITSVLDGSHEVTETLVKTTTDKEQKTQLKEHCNDLIEILDEIADQISGVTEPLEA